MCPSSQSNIHFSPSPSLQETTRPFSGASSNPHFTPKKEIKLMFYTTRIRGYLLVFAGHIGLCDLSVLFHANPKFDNSFFDFVRIMLLLVLRHKNLNVTEKTSHRNSVFADTILF